MVTVIFNGKNKVDRDSQNSSTIIIMEGYEAKNDAGKDIALIKLNKAVKKTSKSNHFLRLLRRIHFQTIF